MWITHRCVKKVSASTEIEKSDAKIIWIFTNQENPVCSKSNNSSTTCTDRENEEGELLIITTKDIIDNGYFPQIHGLKEHHGSQRTAIKSHCCF